MLRVGCAAIAIILSSAIAPSGAVGDEVLQGTVSCMNYEPEVVTLRGTAFFRTFMALSFVPSGCRSFCWIDRSASAVLPLTRRLPTTTGP